MPLTLPAIVVYGPPFVVERFTLKATPPGGAIQLKPTCELHTEATKPVGAAGGVTAPTNADQPLWLQALAAVMR